MGCCRSIADKANLDLSIDKAVVDTSTASHRQGSSLKVDSRSFIKRVQGNLTDLYRLEEEVGVGTFGTVRAAVSKMSGVRRAIKSIQKSKVVQPNEAQMFTEVEVLRRMDHPNIVRVHEVVEDDKYYHIVTELCTGGELLARIITQHQFSENVAARYFYQVMTALMYCHEHNIVHRDIKPENILFVDDRPDSPLKIIDFGVSCMFEPGDVLSKLYGTVRTRQPYYIAPEVLGNQYNEKCDIWSSGVVLYVMLCEA